MFVDGIRHQTSMSVASGQCAQALSHAAAPQKGLYSDRPHGKKKPHSVVLEMRRVQYISFISR